MTLNITYVLLLIVLLVILFQDIKFRAIHIVLPFMVMTLGLVINYLDHVLSFMDMVYNLLFITVNIIGLFLYFSLKERRFFNPIDAMLGKGDILFFIAITPLFSLKPFIVFFIIGLVLSLVTHLVVNMFKKSETIPLAGYLAAFLSLNIIAKTIFKLEIPKI